MSQRDSETEKDFEIYDRIRKEKRKTFLVNMLIGFKWWCDMFIKFCFICWRIIKAIGVAIFNISESMYENHDSKSSKKKAKKSKKK